MKVSECLLGSLPLRASEATPNGDMNAQGKREQYLSWEEYFMAVASLAAQRSKDPETQIGSVIVNPEKKIVGSGYNGMPTGCIDDDMPWSNGSSDPLNNKDTFLCHSEMNTILNSDYQAVKGSTMYTLLFPCHACTKLIVQAGIKEVVYKQDRPQTEELTESKEMLDLVGIRYRQFHSQRRILVDFSGEGDDCVIEPGTNIDRTQMNGDIVD